MQIYTISKLLICYRFKSAVIRIIQRIISTISIPVHAICVADRAGLHKSADAWIIVPGAVVVKTCPSGAGSTDFDTESPAGEHVGIGKEVGF